MNWKIAVIAKILLFTSLTGQDNVELYKIKLQDGKSIVAEYIASEVADSTLFYILRDSTGQTYKLDRSTIISQRPLGDGTYRELRGNTRLYNILVKPSESMSFDMEFIAMRDSSILFRQEPSGLEKIFGKETQIVEFTIESINEIQVRRGFPANPLSIGMVPTRRNWIRGVLVGGYSGTIGLFLGSFTGAIIEEEIGGYGFAGLIIGGAVGAVGVGYPALIYFSDHTIGFRPDCYNFNDISFEEKYIQLQYILNRE